MAALDLVPDFAALTEAEVLAVVFGGFFALCGLLVIAFLKAANDKRWVRLEWEQARAIAEDEIARAEAEVRCLPDPLEVIGALPTYDPERARR